MSKGLFGWIWARSRTKRRLGTASSRSALANDYDLVFVAPLRACCNGSDIGNAPMGPDPRQCAGRIAVSKTNDAGRARPGIVDLCTACVGIPQVSNGAH